MQDDAGSDGVLVQVCIACGTETFYDDSQPPAEQRCEKCGGTVFRSFYADATPEDAAADFADATERDTATNDSPSDITRGDLHDLNNV